MVPTTNHSPEGCSIYSLYGSGLPEDRQLADQVRGLIDNLTEALKPVLPYVCGPEPARICDLPKQLTLVLTKQGEFRALNKHGHPHAFGWVAWQPANLPSLIEGLDNLLAEAEAKKERHLASIKVRRALVDNVREKVSKFKEDR